MGWDGGGGFVVCVGGCVGVGGGLKWELLGDH